MTKAEKTGVAGSVGRGCGRWGMVCWMGLAGVLLADEGRNRYAGYGEVEEAGEGLAWPRGQVLPRFSRPAEGLDAIEVQALSRDEQLVFSALQGLVNRKRPRIYLLDARAGEGRDTWPQTLGLKIKTIFNQENKYDLIKKYAGEVRGWVVYRAEGNPHMRNLAGTVAGLERSLPVTVELRELLRQAGVELPVVVDLTGLGLSTAVETYRHLHERYWPRCEKRFLVSAKPHSEGGGGDYHHTRDLAAACGAAVVWLDNRVPEEREVMRKFLGDMKAGEAVVLGWYTSERSGVTTASEFGIGTLPADHYVSASVLAAGDPRLRIPPVPRMPVVADKAYIAVFISDGDNIQYTQHAMRQFWDRHAASRGKVALNWTIAPGLADVGPGILRYYQGTATPLDCLVSGPSGMGYLMPCNTLAEPGAALGEHTADAAAMDGYARLTEIYLQRSGLRVVTVWDDANPMQRAAYERRCRQLYGVTVQNFRDVPSVASGVENGRLRFEKLVLPYAGTYEHIERVLSRELRRWDRKSPLFLACQVDIWGEMKPDRIVALHEALAARFPVEFVRADHYFNLVNRVGGVPYNLLLDAGVVVRGGGADGQAGAVADGTPATLWSGVGADERWVGVDFGATRVLTRCVLRHAGDHGLAAALNTRAFTVRVSEDGNMWKTAVSYRGNTRNVTDLDFSPVKARYVRVVIDDPGADGIARIADLELYGRDG